MSCILPIRHLTVRKSKLASEKLVKALCLFAVVGVIYVLSMLFYFFFLELLVLNLTTADKTASNYKTDDMSKSVSSDLEKVTCKMMGYSSLDETKDCLSLQLVFYQSSFLEALPLNACNLELELCARLNAYNKSVCGK